MERRVTVIGLVGAKGCGKSTVAKHMCDAYGFHRLRLADPIKEMLKTLGLNHEQVDGDQKEAPLPFLCGETPRHAMQTLGTEWGRRMLGEDLWTHALQQRIMRLSAGRKRKMLVVDDVRFPNEVAMIREMGGLIWSVRRPETEPREGSWIEHRLYDWGVIRAFHLHPSERHWRHFKVDAKIENTRGLDHLNDVVAHHVRTQGFVRDEPV